MPLLKKIQKTFLATFLFSLIPCLYEQAMAPIFCELSLIPRDIILIKYCQKNSVLLPILGTTEPPKNNVWHDDSYNAPASTRVAFH